MRAGADLRLLRAAVFAAACATLAAAGHLSAGGPGVPAWALVTGWLAAFALAVPLAGRERRSTPAFAAALGAGQLALHALYSLGQHGTGHGGASGGGHPVGTIEQARRLLCNDQIMALTEARAARIVSAAGLAPDGGTTTAAHDWLPSGPMLLGHLLAAVAAGWLLRQGERAVWRLLRLARPGDADPMFPIALDALAPALRRALRLARLLCAGAPFLPPARRRPHPARRPAPAVAGIVLPHALTRRGPPPRGAAELALAA
ncbi:hypothetical protein [Streptomyces hainanensis]|uniref:Integral membrane protein n=1 Tax=Streptomyces hainanensis TaxID=402648 RepID=A0A4R4TL69_9ACTN|nr:hypothetical protein [Streptomyces hainanensis]TDC76504.1 hypothetical protein E1283_09595 [Streptomyces hainanensis]